jgi:DNA-binding GntR family transcriptional regulator
MKADSRFHIEVAIATKSERLTRREVALQAESVGLLWTAYLPDAEAEKGALEHGYIVEAIANEDGPAAAETAARHVRNNLRRLIAAHMRLNAPSRRS